MKVLVPGKATAKTAIGECPKCEAILQESVKDLLPSDQTIVVPDRLLGSSCCPNCSTRVKMYALDSNPGRTLVAKVAAYETQEYARSAAGFKP